MALAIEGVWGGARGQEAALLTWLESLGYVADRVEVGSEALERWALGGEEAREVRLTRLGHHPADESFQVLLASLEGMPGDPALGRWLERWAGRLWRLDRTFRGVLVAASPIEVVAAVPFSSGRAEAPGLRVVRLGPGELCEAELERLERLAVRSGDRDAEGVTARLREELDLEQVTRGFFTALRTIHARLAEGVQGSGLGLEARRGLALVTLNRLIFLYFVQRKGLLDGRRDFMRTHLRRIRASGGGIHRRLLRPLFFGLLNTSPERREPGLESFGEVPYLNGGLFEPTRLEHNRPLVEISDEALEAAFDGLLERFAFTTREDGLGVGVDPEMLGRVFESLMAVEQRASTGTFYTPRSAVEALVRRGLAEVLVRHGLRPELAGVLLEGGEVSLPPQRAATLRQRLDDVAVLDPACGSGAFLLGALVELERLHGLLARMAGQPTPAPWALRRRLIARNLHGIDLNGEAVRLCELRLWLSILDATPAGAPIAPLPNLDCRVRQGDALLEPMDWSGAARDLRRAAPLVRELEGLKHDYARADGRTRPGLRYGLEQAERALFESLTRWRIERLAQRRDALKASEQVDLLAPADRTRVRHDWVGCDAEISALEDSLSGLLGDGTAPAFSPVLHFPEVMARGGFDLVLTNPPWVRLHAVPRAQRRLLSGRYQVLRDGAWTAGGMLRDLKGAGSQVDLSACFVERSVELLAPGGAMAALVPSKLLRALYGGGVRRLLSTEAHPVSVEALGEGLFADATAYPLALVARKGPPSRLDMVEVIVDGAPRQVSPRALRLDADDLGSPWWVEAPRGEITALARRGVRLGEHPALLVRRGVMTGCNAAYVDREGLGPEVTAWTLPLLRGGEVGAWRWQQAGTILWPHDTRAAAPLAELPEALRRALAPWRGALEARSGLTRRDPWWRLFRAGPHLFGPKVIWRDIGRRLEAVAVPGEVRVGGRLLPLIPLNTIYFIGVERMEHAVVLSAWLNSTPVRRFAEALAERASGGYRRFFAWLVALLPVPDRLALALRGRPGDDGLLEEDAALRALLHHGRALHLDPDAPGRAARERAIDEAVEALYASSRPRRGLLDGGEP